MSAFTALNAEQQRSIIGGQDGLSGALQGLWDTIARKYDETINGAGSAGSAAGSIGAGATKP